MSSAEELKNDPLRPLILDIGSNTFRLGFAGDDYPIIIAPSVYVETSDYLFATDIIDGLEDIFISEERTKKYLLKIGIIS